MKKILGLMVALTCLAIALPATAQIPGFRRMLPARTIGMAGMGRSFAAGASALYLNPAGLAVVPQYTIGTGYSYLNADPTAHSLNLSWTDSSPNMYHLGMGIAYNYMFDEKDWDSHNVHFGLTFTLPTNVMNIHFGAAGHRLWNAFQTSEDVWNGDLGIILDFSRKLMIGVAGYSLVRNQRNLSPRGVGGGISYWHERFMIGAEMNAQIDAMDENGQEETRLEYQGGLQFMVIPQFYLRGGVGYESTQGRTNVGAGVTIIAQEMIGIELGYQQNVTDTSDIIFSAMLEFYNPFGQGH